MSGRNEPVADATARELFERYYRPVCVFFRRRGFADEDARDLAQQTFLSAFRSIETLRDPNPTSWLFAIAVNVSRNALRSRQAAKRSGDVVSLEADPNAEDFVEADAPDLLEVLLERERRQLLTAAIEELPRG